jgi:hypothetical protein
MKEVGQVVLALVFPVVCLFLLLWLARLEDTLSRDVRRTERKPEPPPILRIPVRSRPVQPQASEVSRSAALSLGGSTNR